MFGLGNNQVTPENIRQNPNKKPVEFHKAMNELFLSVGEKSEREENKFKLPSLDIFGKSPEITWNKADNFKTKVGVLFTLLFCIVAGYVFFYFNGKIFVLERSKYFYRDLLQKHSIFR